jgi:hypothetical protein
MSIIEVSPPGLHCAKIFIVSMGASVFSLDCFSLLELHANKIKRIGDIKSRFFMLLNFAFNALDMMSGDYKVLVLPFSSKPQRCLKILIVADNQIPTKLL